MRRSLIGVLLLLMTPTVAQGEPKPDGGAPTRIVIKVGKHADLYIRAAQGQCDDRSVVRVEDAGDHLRLVGLKEGKTLCGFGGPKAMRFTVYEIIVIPE